MNTLTQQQINQYQWQVSDGVAIIVNNKAYNNEHDIYPSPEWDEFETFCKSNTFSTNAPDGIYSGEAFELGWWKQSRENEDDGCFSLSNAGLMGYDYTPYLKFNPSHLPAVLTTQPGEGWKDRYREVWFYSNDNVWWDGTGNNTYNSMIYDSFVEHVKKLGFAYAKREWHLITPPAEQEAEAVKNIQPMRSRKGLEIDLGLANIKNEQNQRLLRAADGFIEQLQSILTQKDQRISELERLLSKVEGYLVISNKRCKDRGDRIAELEREREWINIEDRLPEDKTKVLCVAVHPNGNRWIQIYRYSTDIGFDWMHDYEPILWIPLPTPPQH